MEVYQDNMIGREEFSDLVDLYHKRVLRKALSWAGNPAFAADIVQNIYLKAWISRHTLRSKEAFGRWIEVICQRECWLEGKRRKDELPLELIGPGQEPSQEMEIETEDDNSLLYGALSKMSANDIELLSLKYFADYSQYKISLLLGIPEKTVKSRLYDARARLRKLMDSMDNSSFGDIGLEFSKRRAIIMNKLKLMEVGGHCIPRMSLVAQRELLSSVQSNAQFSDTVLKELNAIDKGRDFVTLCDGSIDMSSLMEILSCCDQSAVDRMLESSDLKESYLSKFKQGCVVLENSPIIYTENMEATVKWFEDTLGWHGMIDARDEEGNGTYGCLLPNNLQGVMQRTRSFLGIHIFRGEPIESPIALAFIAVRGIDSLYQYVVDSGWTGIEPIQTEPWGARTCYVTTNDGYVLKFFEMN